MRKRSTLAFVWVPLLACGGDDGHHINTIDAKVFKDAPPAACTASTTYGTVNLGSDQDERSYKSKPQGSGQSAPYEEVVGVLNADAAPDILFLDLYPGYTAFGPLGSGEQLKTGTFTLVPDDTAGLATCGICPILATDFGSAGETDDYYAIDGSVTITSFGSNVGSNVGSGWAGTLSGSVTNMHFQHITFSSDGTAAPVGDGCTSSIDSMAFSGTLVEKNTFQNGGRAGYQLKLTHRRFN